MATENCKGCDLSTVPFYPAEVRFDNIPYFMTVAELAELMGETPASIRRGIKEGRIVADKCNGRWRICRDTFFPNAKEALNA